MALADFTFDQDGADAVATLSGSSPIQGGASLLIQMSVNNVSRWALAYTAGLTKECVEARVLLRQSVVGAGNFRNIGIFAQMQGGAAVLNNAYYVGLHNDSFGAVGVITINKGSVDSSITNNSGQANAVAQLPNEDDVVALGIRCEMDSVSGNVLVTALYDPGPITIPVSAGYDFPGLIQMVSYLDAVSPYTTGTFGLAGQIALGDAFGAYSQTFDVLVVDTD